MVVSQIMGGLGNQMFQYAAGRALSQRLQTDLSLDLSWFSNMEGCTARNYALSFFPKLNVRIASGTECRRFTKPVIWRKLVQRLLGYQICFPGPNFIIEPSHVYWDNFMKLSNEVYLSGYWQSEKYFLDIKEIIYSNFTFPEFSKEGARTIADKILVSKNYVAIHIRRGDYVASSNIHAVHGVMSAEYYEKAISTIISQIGFDLNLIVFSDDPVWAKDFFKDSRYPCTVVDLHRKGEEHHDMHLMSLCHHHIIANSSFSWWGAWLCKSPHKIVIAPKMWFADAKINLQTADLIPMKWVRL